MTEIRLFKGTTTVGIICDAGIILGADSQGGYPFIVSKDIRKIYKIDDTIGVTISGYLGDPQALLRLIKAEAKLYKLRTQQSISVKGVGTLLARILNDERYYPYLAFLIVGGVDKSGSKMYSLDPLGGLIEEKKFVMTGSGIGAYGVLEDKYREKISIEEGVDLAICALHNALKRDTGSGGKINIVKITPEGYVTLEEREVKRRRDQLP